MDQSYTNMLQHCHILTFFLKIGLPLFLDFNVSVLFITFYFRSSVNFKNLCWNKCLLIFFLCQCGKAVPLHTTFKYWIPAFGVVYHGLFIFPWSILKKKLYSIICVSKTSKRYYTVHRIYSVKWDCQIIGPICKWHVSVHWSPFNLRIRPTVFTPL